MDDDNVKSHRYTASWLIFVSISLKIILSILIFCMEKHKRRSAYFMIVDEAGNREKVEDNDYLISDYE